MGGCCPRTPARHIVVVPASSTRSARVNLILARRLGWSFAGFDWAVVIAYGVSRNPRLLEMIQPGGVLAGNLHSLLVRNILEDVRHDLTGFGKRRLGVRIVRSPHQVLDADVRPQLDAEVVLLEADEDIAPEEIAGEQAVLEALPCDAHGALGVDVVHARHEVRGPSDLKLDRPHLELGIALKAPGEDNGGGSIVEV